MSSRPTIARRSGRCEGEEVPEQRHAGRAGAIRTRRKEWEQRLPEVVEILKEGSAYAEKTAAATLADVRKSMRIDYFTDDNLLK